MFITYLCHVFLLNEILLSIQLAILYMFVYVYVYMVMGRDGFFALIKYQYHDQATPIYGKNLKKSSSEPVDRFSRNLVCSIGDSNPS